MAISSAIGLITARGGSKGIPRKNVKPLAGKPLIAWTIDVALAARSLHRVLVSTDDEEIAGVAHHYGAEVPFIRPASLAEDNTPHIAVVHHALRWLAAESRLPDYLVLLQPTSPLRTAHDIDAAVALAVEKQATAVVSVTSMAPHPYLSQRILPDGTLTGLMPTEIAYLQRQSLPEAYALNGALYVNRPDSLLKDSLFLPPGTYPYVMPAERSLDVDTLWEFHLAELILSNPLCSGSVQQDESLVVKF